MSPANIDDPSDHSPLAGRMTHSQEDGLVYKFMAVCVFPIPAGILYSLFRRYLPDGSGYFAFGALAIACDIGGISLL